MVLAKLYQLCRGFPQRTSPDRKAQYPTTQLQEAKAWRTRQKTQEFGGRLPGPEQVTKDATIAEMAADGTMTILAKGTNEWVCTPGDENKIGNPPMCMNPMGMRWMIDAMQGEASGKTELCLVMSRLSVCRSYDQANSQPQTQ